MQADGKILVGGAFSTLSGQPRNSIGRLASGNAALQVLAINANGTTATWTRSGAGPEVEQVTFERSTDGFSYIPLGNATRISGGWQLTGLSLPVGQNFYLRARGRTTGGFYNGSSGLIESVAQFYRLPPPQPRLVGPTLLSNGAFKFSFANPAQYSFTVVATTNAAASGAIWEPIGTPMRAANGLYEFIDPNATNSPQRFYQLR